MISNNYLQRSLMILYDGNRRSKMKFEPPYPDKFRAGDVVVSRNYVRFTDGTEHHSGQEIVVTEETETYCNVCHTGYDKKVSK